MVIATAIRRVGNVAHSDSDIEFPLAFIPLRLDGERLGEFRRVRIVRSAPDQVEHIHLRAELDDSAAVSRLAECILVLHDLEHIDANRASFACATPADTARQDLVPFGTLTLAPTRTELPFLVPRHQVGAAHASGEEAWERASEYGDSIAEAAEYRADSIAEAAQAMADSIAELHMHRADSIRELELHRADSIREAGLRLADSLRAAALEAAAP
jgi:hypothetical protein